MFSSTIHYRQCVQRFLQDSNRLLPFNPLDCFANHFATIIIWFLCVSGFGWSPISALARILHWQTAWSKRLNKSVLWFGVSCSAMRGTNHCYQSFAKISIILCAQNHPVALWEGDLSFSKVCEGPLGYAEESPLTLCNHFIQPYVLVRSPAQGSLWIWKPRQSWGF